MKSSKTLALFIIVIVISIGALALTILSQLKADAPFTIAVTKAHAQKFENYQALSPKLNVSVALEIYEDEADLMKAVYSGSVDAYSINVFTYLEQFNDLPKGKAILGLSSDYYLIAKKENDTSRPKIGIFDETLSYYMLRGAKYSTVYYSSTKERLKALYEGLIDYAIISSADYDQAQAIIFKKMSTQGYNEDLFILTNPWIESEGEIGLDIVNQISETLTQETKAPDKTLLMKAMSELFKDEKIHNRYAYEDLVFYKQP